MFYMSKNMPSFFKVFLIFMVLAAEAKHEWYVAVLIAYSGFFTGGNGRNHNYSTAFFCYILQIP